MFPFQTYLKHLFLLVFFAAGLPSFAQTANFTSDVTDGCSPLTVNFQDLSTGSGLNYLWDFGNGNQSTQKDPGAIYIQDGTYTIKLKVWNTSGTDSIVKTAYIRVFAKPVAKFGLSGAIMGCAPVQVSFRDSSQPGSYPIQSWLYDFGDGSVVSSQHPQHTYQQGGSYTVSLQVTDTKGCTHITVKNQYVRVGAPFPIDYTVSNPVSCAPPLTTSFQSNLGGGLSPYSYYWDFDDGNTSTLANPSHTFTSSKIFRVSLRVTDSYGCAQTVSKNSVNTLGPKANYQVNATSGCVPFLLIVKDASTPPASIGGVTWTIGPFQSHSTDTSVIFTLAGTYDVKWKTSAGGCADSLFHQARITVFSSPDINFSTPDTLICRGSAIVQFLSSGKDIVSWKWTFGNGDSSALKHPMTTYQDTSKVYTVQLTATNVQGCTSILTKTNYIHKRTTEVLAYADSTEGCFPFSTNFSATTYSLSPIVSYLWEFGNGDTSSQKDVRYTYPDTGEYFAKITIRDQMGCTATSIKKIRLGLKPRAFFTVDSTLGCSLGLNPKFKSQSQDSSSIFIDEYKWDFGHSEVDGPVDIPNPETYYYIPPGKYTVTLVVGNRGCYDTLKKTDLIQVKGPHAAIGDLSNPCVFDVFKAVDGSFGGNKKWWTYSDGTVEYDPDSIYHKFNETPWQAAFYITDTLTGCWDSVKFTNGLILPYSADPKYEGTRCAPALISYKSFLLNVDSVYYEFSNGFTTNDSSFTVLFEEPGIYSRKLTIFSSQGCSRVVMDTFSIEIKGVKADGRVLNDSFCVPGKLTLVDLTDDLPGIVEKKWVIQNSIQFDVTADTIEYEILTPPPFQYDGLGVYLTISDNAGCTSRKDFRVWPFAPKPSVSINQEPDCNQARYRFKVLNVGRAGFEPVDYVWYFPGGSSNNSQYLGTLPPDVWNNVVLQSVDNFGCTRMDTFPVFGKGGKIKTAFEAFPKFSSCPPLLVSFSDSSQPGEDPIVSWKWDFGDGSTSTLKNPKKNYLVPGNYSIKLEVRDSKGCKSELLVPSLVIVSGPTGTYTFTPSEACERIDVNFSSTNSGATKIEWDLGDGNLGHGASLTHTYVRPGRYIPLMILSNDGGCKYSLPPQDTIFVREDPLASFVSDEGCVGTPQALSSTSIPIDGTIVEQLWFYDNTLIGSGSSINRTFSEPGLESILLRIKTNYGCVDTVIQQVKVPGIALRMESPDSLLCLGEPATYQLFPTVYMDSIAGYSWTFGDGDSLAGSQTSVTHDYAQIGPYRARVEAISQRGCIDSSNGPYVMVGDTVPPNAPFVNRVSIGTNMEFIAEYAPSKHIDFNQYLLELQEEDSDFYLVSNRFDRNDTNFVHPSLNTLHRVYRFRIREENACGKISKLAGSTIHGSIELLALPDTNAVHLNWNPYEGWLPGYYVIERENESDPLVFDSIAYVPSDSLHFIDTLIRCYAHPNYRIRAVQAESPYLYSRSDTSKASPPHRPELPVHDLQRISVEYDREVFSEWIEPYYSKFPVTGYLLEYSKDGEAFYSVKDWLNETQMSLTKTSLLVDDQSYYFRITVKDSCGDIGPPGPHSRSILLRTGRDTMERPVLHWSSYIGWENVPETYAVERVEPDGSIITLAMVGPNDTVFVDEITEDVGRPDYCYRITAYEYPKDSYFPQVWSHSNISCAPVRSRIFVANAFTPNGDHLNDDFEVKGMYIFQYEIRIYTRWGEHIFESESFKHHWNGTYKGIPCQEDVYIYIIDALGTDGKRYHLKGNITLLP